MLRPGFFPLYDYSALQKIQVQIKDKMLRMYSLLYTYAFQSPLDKPIN